MRIDYTDGALRAKIYELFDTSFPRISARIRTAESLGAKWHDVSTAFIEFVDEVPAAHAGVIFIPLVITGKECVVAGIHAVCTHPEFRGRGLARNVLREALAFADTKSETAVLTTAIPDLYARFGFRVFPETITEYHGSRPPRATPAARRLDAASPRDLMLLHTLLERREPVSYALSAVDPGWLVIINEVLACGRLDRMYYAEPLEAVLVLETAGHTLKVLDVIGADIPDAAALLATVPMEYERVEFHFAPDRLGEGPFAGRAQDPGDCLMVRGPLATAGDVMLPPLGRC